MSEIEVIPIRYDGGDATQHQIDLANLGMSLQGMSRVLALVGHFAVTGKVATQGPALAVRVVAHEDPKANCFTIQTALQFAQQQQLFQGSVTVIIGAVVGWLIGRASDNKTEMKYLNAALQKSLDLMAQGNAESIRALTGAVERLAEVTRPALREAVQPVGRSCTSMTIAGSIFVDEAAAEAIRRESPEEVDMERQYDIRITELDLENRTAKVRLMRDEHDSRFSAQITDPALQVPDNRYVRAFSSGEPIEVRAKAAFRDGTLLRLYISNAI